MGLLVDGVWKDQWYDTKASGGRFERQASRFRNWVTPDGSAGPSGDGGFPATAGRYHLYVSLACPWAHRAIIFRKLKQLENVISLSVVSPHMGSEGWTFDTSEGSTGDPLFGASKLYEVYLKADPHLTGRVTVPVLWDKERQTIVNNESSEIIRMLNSAFDALTSAKTDYYPVALRGEIDRVNDRVYPAINNGVYRAGFATMQVAYEEAFRTLFAALDEIEQRLSQQRYLVGQRLTEADWRLFTTLVRFDAVYYSHFKCNLRRIIDYPSLWPYLRDLYQVPGVAETVSLDHIKRHYYGSHPQINPTGIVPLGPALDFSAPQDRARLFSSD
jgi:putative glutathione S-transferase